MNTEIHNLILKAQSGDKEAESKIFEDNIGLIWSVAKRFSNRGYDADDIFQIGSIGMIKAIQKFDLSFNVKFSTYAVPMIMGEIKRFLRDDGIIKVSRNLKELAYKANYAREQIEKRKGADARISEIADFLNISTEDVVQALEANSCMESLYQTVNDDSKSPVYIIDRINNNENNENDLIDMIDIKESLRKLDYRDRQIIVMRYIKGKTQSEIAKALGISQVQVSRLEKKILINMRKMIS